MTSSEASHSADFKFKSKVENHKQITLERPRPEDTDEFFASFAEDKRKRLMELQHKYNFDFVNGEPLPGGRYEWQLVDSSRVDGDQGSKTSATKVTGEAS